MLRSVRGLTFASYSYTLVYMFQNQALLHEQQGYIVAVFCCTLKYVLGKDQILSLCNYKHFLQIAYNVNHLTKNIYKKKALKQGIFPNLKWNKM